MDHVTDLRMEPKELADRSFRFLKVPAKLLLNKVAGVQTDIDPEDLADLLARSGIDLIAERIETETWWSICSTTTCASARASCSHRRGRCAPRRCKGPSEAAGRSKPTVLAAANSGAAPSRRHSAHDAAHERCIAALDPAFLRRWRPTTTCCCATSGAWCITASPPFRTPATR